MRYHCASDPASVQAKRSACVALEVDLWECTLHLPPQKANKADQTSPEKTGVSVAPKKDMCPPKTSRKKTQKMNLYMKYYMLYIPQLMVMANHQIDSLRLTI